MQQASDPQHHIEAVDHMTCCACDWIKPETEADEKQYDSKAVQYVPFTRGPIFEFVRQRGWLRMKNLKSESGFQQSQY